MRLVEFSLSEHLSKVNEWLEKRGMAPVPMKDIPNRGYIVHRDGIYIAAGFLRRCEGDVGIFDSLITNPELSLYTRHLAIELLIEKIITVSKELHIDRLIAFSTDSGTIKRSKKHGFEKKPYTVISLSLDT